MTPPLPQGLPPETPLRGLPLAVWDLETTGLDPWSGARILQVGVVHHDLGQDAPVLVYQSLVDPGGPVPDDAAAVHGLSTERMAHLRATGHAPSWDRVWPMLRFALQGRVSAGYNLSFDAAFIRAAQRLPRVSSPPIALDAMLLGRRVLAGLRRHRLADVAAHLGVHAGEAHDAGEDALATARVLGSMLPLLEACGLRTLGDAVAAQEAVRATAEASYASR